VICSYMAGPVGNRDDRMTVISVASLAGGVVAVLLLSIDVPMWAVAGLATVSVGLLGIGWPVFMTFGREVSGRSRSTAVGLLGASNQVSGVCGTAVGGVLLGWFGFPGIGYLCLGTVAVSSVISDLFMRETGAGREISH